MTSTRSMKVVCSASTSDRDVFERGEHAIARRVGDLRVAVQVRRRPLELKQRTAESLELVALSHLRRLRTVGQVANAAREIERTRDDLQYTRPEQAWRVAGKLPRRISGKSLRIPSASSAPKQ